MMLIYFLLRKLNGTTFYMKRNKIENVRFNSIALSFVLELADFGLAIEVNGEQTQWYGMY